MYSFICFYRKADGLIRQAGFEIIDIKNLSDMHSNYFVAAKI